MPGQEVSVTYFHKNSNLSGSIVETEITVKRSWTGMGYEPLSALAARYVPLEGTTWITAPQGDTVTVFRVSDLESMEFIIKEE